MNFPRKENGYPLYMVLVEPRAVLDMCGKSRPNRNSITGRSSSKQAATRLRVPGRWKYQIYRQLARDMAGLSSLLPGQLHLPGNTPALCSRLRRSQGQWQHWGSQCLNQLPDRVPPNIYMPDVKYTYDSRISTFLNHIPVDMQHLVVVCVVGLWGVRKHHNLEI
jgi:hypothetical protein